MGRKIILLSDGTGNSSGKVWRTNVWRTFEALDLSGDEQVAFYDDGVGTSSFKPLAILGGVFGFGLKRNVIALYKFACRNYRNPDDEFFLFGFSRGAFTVRIVAGLMLSEGLVRADNEGDLHRGAVDAYRAYRRKKFHTRWRGHPEDLLRNIRDLFAETWRAISHFEMVPTQGAAQNFKIRFIGVWDTVAAYGLPIDEMTRGVSNWIWPLGLPDHQFDRHRVLRGCHALALDEERTTFHPELWNERIDAPGAVTPREVDITRRRFIWDHSERICQVWFSGVHSNVGGGYPDDSLAYIPFVWMITEARRAGLVFKTDFSSELPAWPPSNRLIADPDTFKAAVAKRDKDGRLYDPRKGLGAYYRYGPRKLVALNQPKVRNEDDEVLVERPKIHESVLRRIRNSAHGYAPAGLPAHYDIVTDSGEIFTPNQYPHVDVRVETDQQAADRAAAQERVWNRIWWRKLVYYLTLAATLWLAAMPFVDDADPGSEIHNRFRWISVLIRFVGDWLPGFTKRWIDGYAAEPLWFLFYAFIVVALTWLGGRIASDISDKMRRLWRHETLLAPGPIDRGLLWLRNTDAYAKTLHWAKHHGMPGLFAIFVVYGAVAIANKAIFVAYDSAGYACTAATKAETLKSVGPTGTEEIKKEFSIRNLCTSTGINLEAGARYNLTITIPDGSPQWTDGRFDVPPGGFSSAEITPNAEGGFTANQRCLRRQQINRYIVPASWSYRFAKAILIPFRRAYGQDWLRLIARVGSDGTDEDYYRPDPTDCKIQWIIRPKQGGEFFIYVNDAILGLPGLTDYFYRDNVGTGHLTVTRK